MKYWLSLLAFILTFSSESIGSAERNFHGAYIGIHGNANDLSMNEKLILAIPADPLWHRTSHGIDFKASTKLGFGGHIGVMHQFPNDFVFGLEAEGNFFQKKKDECMIGSYMTNRNWEKSFSVKVPLGFAASNILFAFGPKVSQLHMKMDDKKQKFNGIGGFAGIYGYVLPHLRLGLEASRVIYKKKVFKYDYYKEQVSPKETTFSLRLSYVI